MSTLRIQRMLRELNSEPSLQFFQALFSLPGIAAKQGAAVRKSTESYAAATTMPAETEAAR